MMRNRLLLLAAVAAVAVVLVFVGQQAPVDDAGNPRMYPDLQSRVNDIDRVEIAGPGEAAVGLVRDGERWLVEQPGGYPADVSKLRQLLLGLAAADLIEAKTGLPEYYERLGLQGFDAADSPTRRLTLHSGEQTLADVWIGDRRQGESFVRRDGETQTWLVSGRIEASARPVDWVHKAVVDIARQRVRSIAVQPPQAQPYRLERASAEAQLALAELPEATRLKTSVVQRLAGALQALELSDVESLADAGAEAALYHNVRFETFDGLAVEARLSKRDEKFFLRLQFGSAEPSAATDDAGKAAVVDELARLRQTVEPWQFTLSDYDGGSLALLRADLLENQTQE